MFDNNSNPNVYLDAYSMPSMDYQDSIVKQGYPISFEEYNSFEKEIYYLLQEFIDCSDKPMFKSVLEIANRYVIVNIASYLKYHLCFEGLTHYNIIYTPTEAFKEKAEKRNLSTDYLEKFINYDNPFLDYWFKDYFDSHWKSIIKTILTKIRPYYHQVATYNPNKWLHQYIKDNNIKYNILWDEYFWSAKDNPKDSDILGLTNKQLNIGCDQIAEQIIRKMSISIQQDIDYIHFLMERIIYKVSNDLQKTIKFNQLLRDIAGGYKTVLFTKLYNIIMLPLLLLSMQVVFRIYGSLLIDRYIEYNISYEHYIFNHYGLLHLNKEKIWP